MLVIKVKKRKFKIPEVPQTRWLQLRDQLSLQRRRAAAFVSPRSVAASSAPSAVVAAGAQGAVVDEVKEEECVAPPVAVDEETLARMRADLQRLQERKTELFTVLKEVLAQDEKKRLQQAAEAAKARAESEAAERRLQSDEMRAAPALAPGAQPARSGFHGIRGAMYQQHFPGMHCAAASACCGDEGAAARAGGGYAGGGGGGGACQPHFRCAARLLPAAGCGWQTRDALPASSWLAAAALPSRPLMRGAHPSALRRRRPAAGWEAHQAALRRGRAAGSGWEARRGFRVLADRTRSSTG